MMDFIDAAVFKHKIPIDVLRAHLLPFVHAHPPTDLLRDIRSYASSYQRIMQIYRQIWVVELGEAEGQEVHWFENDLLNYQQESYTENFHSVTYRIFFTEVRSLIRKIKPRPSPPPPGGHGHGDGAAFTRRCWGALPPEIREEMIQFRRLEILSIVELMIW